MTELVFDFPREEEWPHCRVCGCWEYDPCHSGCWEYDPCHYEESGDACWWQEADLCSECAYDQVAIAAIKIQEPGRRMSLPHRHVQLGEELCQNPACIAALPEDPC